MGAPEAERMLFALVHSFIHRLKETLRTLWYVGISYSSELSGVSERCESCECDGQERSCEQCEQ